MKLHNHEHLKQNPFEVPNGYFENMQSQIVSNVFPHERKTIKLVTPLLKYAAAAVILITTGTWFLLQQNTNPSTDNWTEVVISNIDSYETELLMSYADIGEESELFETDDFLLLKEDINTSELYKNKE